MQESVIPSLKTKMFTNPPHTNTYTHTHVRSRTWNSELVMVLGEVLSVVGGLTSHKHVPVFKDLLFGQHLVLRRGGQGKCKISKPYSNDIEYIKICEKNIKKCVYFRPWPQH